MSRSRYFNFASAIIAASLGGCGTALVSPENSFLGVEVSDADGTKSLTIDMSTSTSASTSVHIPIELLETAADNAKLVFAAKEASTEIAKQDSNISASSHEEATVEVTFYVAKSGDDACTDGEAVGPVDVTITNDELDLANTSITLTGKALSIVKKGNFELCVVVTGSYSGTIDLDQLKIEFGELADDKKVTICHVPHGDPDNPITIEVGLSAQTAHLAHGDYLGECVVDEPNNEPIDTDADGVTDDLDTCAATPTSEPVNDQGCSCSQLDEDADGVNNCGDFCPGTAEGTTTDTYGCPMLTVNAGEDQYLTSVSLVTLSGSATGGTPPYTYSWTANEWAGSGSQAPTVMVTETTVYTLTVMDMSFPPSTATATVTVYLEPDPSLMYTIVDLGTLSNNGSFAAGMNNRNDVVGYYFTDDFRKKAFLYTAGAMSEIGALSGNESEAFDINIHGFVVGRSKTIGGDWHAFVWDPSRGMVDLGTFGGSSSSANAINDNGQIVGVAETSTESRAFIINPGGALKRIDEGIGLQSASYDINEDGLVVGMYTDEFGNQNGFSWKDNVFTDHGVPLLGSARLWSINDAGLMTGHAWEGDQFATFVLGGGMAADLGFLSGFPRTNAWSINDQGQLAGHLANSDGTILKAFVATGGQLFNLNTMLSEKGDWEELSAAFAINNSGLITGYGRINGQYRGFLLTPTNAEVPTP